jgi:HlyD family secretion protein
MTPVQKRLLFWTPFALALVGALAWLLRPAAVTVELLAVDRGALAVSISDEGETRVRDVYSVSAPVPGRMRRVELEVGDEVVADQTVVARIEPSAPLFLDVRSAAEARAGVDAAAAARTHAEAQVRRAEAEFEFARAEFARIRELARSHTVSANDLDAAQLRARTTEAALAEARAERKVRESEYQVARARLVTPATTRQRTADCDCVTVYSPVSGTVLRVFTESEGVVPSGAPLVEVGDPHQLEIVVDLLSADAVRVAPGQRVVIEAWGGDQPLAGRVRRVEPFGFTKVSALGIEEQRVNVLIDMLEPREHWHRLGHGYRVEPRIMLWESDSVLRVPLSALFRQGDRWAVFVERNGRAELRQVDIGQENGLAAEVRSGLAVGERVVLHPGDRVFPGARLMERGA